MNKKQQKAITKIITANFKKYRSRREQLKNALKYASVQNGYLLGLSLGRAESRLIAARRGVFNTDILRPVTSIMLKHY